MGGGRRMIFSLRTAPSITKKYFYFFQKPIDKSKGVCYNMRVLTRAPAVLAQLDRVPGYEPVGRGFESLTPCQEKADCESNRLFQ